MAFALIIDTEAQSSDGVSVTTPGVDTSGSQLFVVAVFDEGGTSTLTDSRGNTWVPRTAQNNAKRVQLWDCLNPIVGGTHTFTATADAGSTFPAIAVQAFSGSHASAAFDAENGANQAAGDPTIQPGTVTPAQDNELFVTAVASAGGGTVVHAVDSSFIETADLDEAGNSDGGAMAYKIQTTGGAENPTWTASGGPGPAARSTVIAAYKAAAVAGLSRGILRNSVNLRPAVFVPGIAR